MHPRLCITHFAKFVEAVPLSAMWERNHETMSGGATLTRSKAVKSICAVTTNRSVRTSRYLCTDARDGRLL